MTTLSELISCQSDYDPEALPVERANQLIRSFVEPIAEIERVPVRAGLGRVLGEDIVSPIDVPAHDNSAMDGYAVRAADLAGKSEVALEEVGASLAGNAFHGRIGRGQCVRVMTGAVMPEGADAVVIQEVVAVRDERVIVPAGIAAGENLRRAGEDLSKGSVALRAGTWIRPAELGLIASLGIPEIDVRRRLRVTFFSTGDELRSFDNADAPPQPLAPGEVYDSNRYTLYGMLTRLGCEVRDMGVVRDDPALLEAAFSEAAADADAIVTSGGVSVGAADFTKHMMAKLGEVVFWKIAMRPGRPMAFGRIASAGRTAVLFGLPGNPVAVMVTFYHFVRGALLRMMGRADTDLPLLRVRSETSIRKKPGRTEYQRGILRLSGNEWTVRLTGLQGSGILRSMSEANCFVVLRHEQGNVNPGEMVEVMLMDALV